MGTGNLSRDLSSIFENGAAPGFEVATMQQLRTSTHLESEDEKDRVLKLETAATRKDHLSRSP